MPPPVTQAPFPALPERHAFPRPWGRPGGCGCDPYFSVVPAAAFLHAAGQGGEAGFPGLPAGSR